MASLSDTSRPLYTPQQLHEVYDRINLPSRYRYEPGEFSKEVIRHRDGFNFLSALQAYTLANIPFENLELHYSPHHQVSIHPDALFDKIVRQGRGRGGYCMENNVFFGTVLRSLGFSVMSVGGRINSRNKPSTPGSDQKGRVNFGGWSHMVNLVTIRGETFMVDVGFGPRGPVKPLPMEDGTIALNIPPADNVRLRRDKLPESENTSNTLWILERRTDEGLGDSPWIALYCFEDFVCFLPQDFEVMNFFVSVHRTSIFTHRVMCCKYLMDEGQEQVIGEVILAGDEVHERVRGEKRSSTTLSSEKERVDALKKHFGISLSQAQRAGIIGLATALPPEW